MAATTGYLYCFSNPSMPNILKIGMTERTPIERLKEANASDTWRPPTPYEIEFAKKVLNPGEKEMNIHLLLTQYTERINPRREFFRVSSEEVLKFFDLMDGEMWTSEVPIADEEDNESETEIKGCRDMSKCFTNGQRIRHKIGINKIRIGIYDSAKNGIQYQDSILSLNKFVSSHYKAERPDRTPRANAWAECSCEVDGQWLSTFCLPPFQ